MKKILISISCMLFLFVNNSCRKDVAEDPATRLPAVTSASIGEPEDFDEETITAFIDDIKYYDTHDEELFVNGVTAVNKMEATLNWVFSDLDTTFGDWDTTLFYTVALTPGEGDQYDMREIADAMYSLKSVILDRMDDNVGAGLASRLITANFAELSANTYEVEMQFGKADLSDPTTTEPAAVPVGSGTYVWGNNNCYNSCTQYTVQTMTLEGNQRVLANLNSKILTSRGAQLLIYFNGINKMPTHTKTVGGQTHSVQYVDYTDVTGMGYAGFPNTWSQTPTTNPPGVQAPLRNVMFAKNIDGYVIDVTNACLDYCVPSAEINYYLDKVVPVWNYVRPTAFDYPLGGYTYNTWPTIGGNYRFTVHEGFGPGLGAPGYTTMKIDDYIYHSYYYQFTKLKFRSVADFISRLF